MVAVDPVYFAPEFSTNPWREIAPPCPLHHESLVVIWDGDEWRCTRCHIRFEDQITLRSN